MSPPRRGHRLHTVPVIHEVEKAAARGGPAGHVDSRQAGLASDQLHRQRSLCHDKEHPANVLQPPANVLDKGLPRHTGSLIVHLTLGPFLHKRFDDVPIRLGKPRQVLCVRAVEEVVLQNLGWCLRHLPYKGCVVNELVSFMLPHHANH